MKFILFMLLHSLGFQERRDFLKSVPFSVNEKICKNCKFFKKDFFTETKYGHCSRFPLNLPGSPGNYGL
jgi:hypothetical protein